MRVVLQKLCSLSMWWIPLYYGYTTGFDLTGTPTFFINNVLLESNWNLEALMSAIESSRPS